MGSSALDELCEAMESFKRGEITQADVENVFRCWQERNRKSTKSMKEKQVQAIWKHDLEANIENKFA